MKGRKSMRVHVVLDKDEDGFWVAEVPAMPGCLSQGKSREEALSNIRDAIEGWLEVMQSKSGPANGELVEVTV
jgi:predicted RNase H-like HicB family nuclease